MINNITANESNCTWKDVFSATEIAVTTAISAVALLCFLLGMLIGACLNHLVRRKINVKKMQLSIMEGIEKDAIISDEGNQNSDPTPFLSETETMQMKIEMIEQKLLNSEQLKRSHSRKSLPPPPPEYSKPMQRSNSVSYDEVDLAKMKSKFKAGNRFTMELKDNQSYASTEKQSAKVANCPLYPLTPAKSQQDLVTSYEYPEVPKLMSVKVKAQHNLENIKVSMKSNSSYGHLTSSCASRVTGGQELLHEYDYVEPN